MSRKIRFTIYGIVALFIAGTYFLNKSESFVKLPVIGKVPSFILVDSENKKYKQFTLGGSTEDVDLSKAHPLVKEKITVGSDCSLIFFFNLL